MNLDSNMIEIDILNSGINNQKAKMNVMWKETIK